MDMQTINKLTKFDDVSQREVFAPAQHAEAAAYMKKVLELKPDTVDQVINLPVIENDAGEPTYDFPVDSNIIIVRLREKLPKQTSRDRALLVTHAPTFEQFMADEKGQEWIASQWETGINRRLLQRYLQATKPDAGIAPEDVPAQLPVTVDDFAISTRTAGVRIDLGAYSALRPLVLATMNKSAAIARYNLNSELLRKALQSEAFAETMYPDLEKAGVFTRAYSLFRQLAAKHNADLAAKKEAGTALDEKTDVVLDTELFDTWEANRSTVTFTTGDDATGLDDLDALFATDDDDTDESDDDTDA